MLFKHKRIYFLTFRGETYDSVLCTEANLLKTVLAGIFSDPSDADPDEVALWKSLLEDEANWEKDGDVGRIHFHQGIGEDHGVDIYLLTATNCPELRNSEPGKLPITEGVIPVDMEDPEIVKIVGTVCTQCIGAARVLQHGGWPIPTHAEEEQAYVILWMLALYAWFGKDWASYGQVELNAVKERVLAERDAAACKANDTDGDGRCGRLTCPVCHPEKQPVKKGQ